MKKTVSLVLTLSLCLTLTVSAWAEDYTLSPVADLDSDVVVSDSVIEMETDPTDPSEYLYLKVDPTTVPEESTQSLEQIEEDENQTVAEVVKVKLMMGTDAEDQTGYPKDVSDEDIYTQITTTFSRNSSGTVVAVWAFNSASGTWAPITFSATGSTVTCNFTTLTYDCVVFMVEDEDAKSDEEKESDEKADSGKKTGSDQGRKSPQTGDNSLWLIGGTVCLLCAAVVCCGKGRKIKD